MTATPASGPAPTPQGPTTAPARAPVRPGPALPAVSIIAGILAIPAAVVFGYLGIALMVTALVAGIIGIRRRAKLWGMGVVGIVGVVVALPGLLVPPLLVTGLAFAAGARSDDFGAWWDMYWGMAVYVWQGPFAQ